MPLLFNDLFTDAVVRDNTLMMRHVPIEAGLRADLPFFAATAPEIYNAYQQTQAPREEAQLARAGYLASFIGHRAGQALFIALYRKRGQRTMSFEEYWDHPAYRTLQPYGIRGLSAERGTCQWFDLEEVPDFYGSWKGKLIIDWRGGERSWSRWVKDMDYPIHAILEDSLLDPPVPHWRDLRLTWQQLALLPNTLQSALRHWRGIYFIFDETAGKGYVGSASGEDNLLQRWRNYADNGHGGNQLLRGRDPNAFRFTILELLSPALPVDDVVAMENSWKMRLNTRAPYGLNLN